MSGDGMWTKYVKELSDLFDELVPVKGKADGKAGEIIRAVNRIIYRYFNDGDQIGIGYGRETVNSPARFLMIEAGIKVGDFVRHLWGLPFTDEYERYLDYLAEAVIELIDAHPELRQMPTKDMLDYTDPEEDVDNDDYEDEYDDDEYYEEDDDEDFDF